MGQKARPVGPLDVIWGGWTPRQVWQHINGAAPNGSGVTSANGVSGDTFEVKLEGMAVPDSRAVGTHRLKVDLKRTGVDPVDVAIFLMQGSRRIAKWTRQPADTGYETETLELTQEEAGLITDYADLRVRVVAGKPSVPCCPGDLPDTLYVTLSEATNDCGCVEGIYELDWNGSGWGWGGTMCGQGASIDLSCQDAGGLPAWSMIGITAQHAYEWTCSPLVIDYGQRTLTSPLCTGSVRIVVTEEEP